MSRDPLDELIEELEKTLPPRPLSDRRLIPNVYQFGEMLRLAESRSKVRSWPSGVEAPGVFEAASDVQDDDCSEPTES
jgi:hypothetical protein